MQRTLRLAQANFEVAWIHPCNQFAFLHFVTHADRSRNQGAGDAKGKVHFLGGLGAPGKTALSEPLQITHFHHPNGANHFLLGRLLTLAPAQQSRQCDYRKGQSCSGMSHVNAVVLALYALRKL